MKYWICVGTTLELPRDGSFISRTAMGVPIVLQRFGDDIACFVNVCAHRASELKKPGSQGCGPLKCPYHGWQFGADGSPTAIPSRSDFCEHDQSRSLIRWSVDAVGKLLFVSLEPTRSLKESIGTRHYRMLAELTANLGEVVDDYRRPIAAHWNTVVENTLEAYHVPFVHGGSIGRMRLSRSDTWRSGSGSGMAAEVDAGKSATAIEALVPELILRQPRVHGYIHIFLYPNFTLASTHGMTYALQFIEPASSGIDTPITPETNFRTLLYAANIGEIPEARRPLLKALNSSAAQMNRQTFDEDADICEAVQRGAAWAPAGYGDALGDCEDRVRWFREAVEQLEK